MKMSGQIYQFFYSELILAGDRSTSLKVVTPFYLICIEKYLVVKTGKNDYTEFQHYYPRQTKI
jgi:hypothetical protein